MESIIWHTWCSLLIAALLFTALPAVSVNAATGPLCYVNDDASGGNNGNSWTDAYTSLQSALADTNCTEIWVAAGVYKPGSARTDTFTLKNGVAIYGGFNGTETQPSQRDWQTNKTILSGDIDNNDTDNNANGIIEPDKGDTIVGSNAYHVVTGSGTNNTAVLDGFIITAGQANGSTPNSRGGGIYNYTGSPTVTNVTFSGNWALYRGGGMFNIYSSSPTLTNVTFSGNTTTNYGGGMYNYNDSNPMLTNVTFSGNQAASGGGIYNDSSSPTLTDVTFSGNTATNYGGGMSNNYSSNSTLTDVIFSGNTADDGGGIYNEESSPTLTNATFSGNTADNGGGMYNNWISSPTLTNVTFSGNSATYGGGMYNFYNSNPTLTNVIVWGNTATNAPSIYNNSSTPTISYSDIQGCGGTGISWNPACGTDGSGNIDADPRFVNAAGGNLRLQLTSPAIDAGNNLSVTVTTDLDGNPRFVDISTVPDTGNGTPPIVDMGAHESRLELYAAPTAQGSGNCSTWANACTLPTALTDAVGGNEIWVKMGIHYPGASGNRSATFQLKNNVAVYGGFAGSETSREQRNWQANKTILSGDIDNASYPDDHGGDFINENASQIRGNNAYHVVTGSGTNNTAVLDGFIITAGQANGSDTTHTRGGGMYNYTGSPTVTNVTFSGNWALNRGGGMYNSQSSSPTLTNITFSGNWSSLRGGGMYNWTSSPTLTNVTFSGNTAATEYGGGIYNDSSSPTLTGVTFSGNTAKDGGGMSNNYSSNSTLTNVTFSGNTATNYGGGMYNEESSPTLTNVTFAGNSASNRGGGMSNSWSSSPTLTNVTFSGNSATSGGGMYNANNSSPTLTNVIVWGNTATNAPSIYNNSSTPSVSYSDIQGGYSGMGNIDADPLFVDAANGNLRLDFGSPAIESGTNTGCPSTDLDGLPRPADGNGDNTATCEMGAYEAGTMICGVEENSLYSFDTQSGVSILISARGNELNCLYVDEMETNHPNATPGIQTGRYWLIRGLQSDKQANATGFTLSLTLPTTFTPEEERDKVCRYTGSGQVWDCVQSTITSNSITREGITALSEWAVGNDVGPTAVKLRDVRATSSTSPFAWLFTVVLAIGLWIRKALPSR